MASDLNLTFLHQCQAASNLTVVCSDGVIFSHKLIAASASDFIKILLSDVPPYDEVTLYLPDFTKCQVELFFESVFSSGTHTEHDIFIESEEREPPVCIQIKKEEGGGPNYEDFSLADHDSDDDDIEEDFVKELLEPSPGYSLEDRVRLIKNLKPNPIYEAEEEEDTRGNEINEKRSKYGKALVNVERFHSVGKRSKILTREEELEITEIILSKTNNGKDLTNALLQQILQEELEAIKTMQPHREGVFKVCPHPGLNYSFFSYMYDFARRNGLHKLLKQTQEQGQENKDHISEGPQPKDRNAARGQFSIEDLKEEEQMTIPNPTTENERSGISGGPKVMERSTAAAGGKFSFEDLKEEDQMTRYFIPNPTTENERSDIYGRPKVKERSTAAASGQFSIEELKEEEEQLIRDLILHPTTEKEKRDNEKLEKKIKYGKAMMEVLNGSHIRPAARKFGVAESTLRWSYKHGKKYYGGGNHTKVLTPQEEREISKRMLAISNGGEDLTHSMMRQILREELDVIKVNEPHREEIFRVCPGPVPGKVKQDYFYNFATRNDLLRFTLPESEERKKRRIHKCDLCEKSYALKNGLMYHRKQVHLL